MNRYDRALSAAKAGRDGCLVYLTLPDASPSVSEVRYVHLTLDQVLSAWIPYAGLGNGSEQYLSRYLKSIALILGCAGTGRFDDWKTAQQAAALDLVEAIHEESWTR